MASFFISYSRKSIEAARKLTQAFRGSDLDFWIDWEGIPPTVDWWKEIETGIERADNLLRWKGCLRGCFVQPNN